MWDEYGEDAVFLLGGSLLSHTDSIADSTRIFLEEIQRHAHERLEAPQDVIVSACDLPSVEQAAGLLQHLVFKQG